MPNFVSFAASIAELAYGEKSPTQSLNQSIAHPAYLMPRDPKRLRFTIGSLFKTACQGLGQAASNSLTLALTSIQPVSKTHCRPHFNVNLFCRPRAVAFSPRSGSARFNYRRLKIPPRFSLTFLKRYRKHSRINSSVTLTYSINLQNYFSRSRSSEIISKLFQRH